VAWLVNSSSDRPTTPLGSYPCIAAKASLFGKTRNQDIGLALPAGLTRGKRRKI
jgi:hypothetical protein